MAALLRAGSAAAWPGTVAGTSLVPWGALIAIVAIVIFGALAPLRFIKDQEMRHAAGGQVMLGIPAFQLGMGLAILLSSAVLLRHGRQLTAGPSDRTVRAGFVIGISSGRQDPAGRAREFEALLNGLEHTPGVSAASLTSPGELLGLGAVDDVTTDCGNCYRGGIYLHWDRLATAHHLVSPRTLAVQDIPLLEGRSFGAGDGFDAPRVALVSRHLALKGFQPGGPVGRDIYLGDDWPERPYRVVGVVADRKPMAVGGALEPLDTIYLNVLQHPAASTELLVQVQPSEADSAAMMAKVSALLDPRSTARLLGSADQIVARAELPIRWFGRWFGLMGVMVLASAVVGTFTTMSMWVRSSAQEMAVRRSAGATRRRMIAWVFSRTVGTGIKGTALGLVCFFGAARISLTSLVGNLPIWDPVLFGALTAILLGAAAAGALLPAARLLRRPIVAMEGR